MWYNWGVTDHFTQKPTWQIPSAVTFSAFALNLIPTSSFSFITHIPGNGHIAYTTRGVMLTPPFHFGIVACPLSSTPSTSSEILYRGAVPAKRNFAHLDRLRIKTILYLRSAPLDEDDSLAVWGSSKSCRMVWVKADEMTEEKVGIGKNEMGEVIKTILDPSVYPLYIADINGTSHTTLVVACLRKLQGWHIDSIIGEICRSVYRSSPSR